MLPRDLHVLSLPLAFILSQDQTLRCIYKKFNILRSRFFLLEINKVGTPCFFFFVLQNFKELIKNQHPAFYKIKMLILPYFYMLPKRLSNLLATVFPFRGDKGNNSFLLNQKINQNYFPLFFSPLLEPYNII